MARRFDGQVAWITGAGSGIGKALALELASRGAAVAVSGRRAERLEGVAQEIERAGGRALPVPCDVTDESEVEAAVQACIAELGQLDVAIANAGFSVTGKVETLSAEDWRRQFDTNVVGAAMTARFALPHLRKTAGRIGLVGSVSAMMPAPTFGPYTASKYALRAIGQTLAIELHGSGVSATLLHPGFVESEIGQVDGEGVFDESRQDKRPKAVMWKADRAASVMVDALHARRLEFVFTGHGKVGAFLGRHAPGIVHLAMTRGPAARTVRKMRKK